MKKKSPAKNLWELCRAITRKKWGNECYTCGAENLEGGNFQTGHFIPAATCSTEVKYDLKNLRPQCLVCNKRRSGNWVAYQERLIIENGRRYVLDLIARNEQTRGTPYGPKWFREKAEEYATILANLPERELAPEPAVGYMTLPADTAGDNTETRAP